MEKLECILGYNMNLLQIRIHKTTIVPENDEIAQTAKNL